MGAALQGLLTEGIGDQIQKHLAEFQLFPSHSCVPGQRRGKCPCLRSMKNTNRMAQTQTPRYVKNIAVGTGFVFPGVSIFQALSNSLFMEGDVERGYFLHVCYSLLIRCLTLE